MENEKSGNVKKIIFGVIVLLSIFIVICCLMGNDDSEKSIKKLVDGYCETIKEFDLDSADQYIAFGSDYWVNLNENIWITFMDIFKESASNIEYTIEDIKVDEEQEIFSWADVTVHFRFLDYSKVMSNSLERFEHEIYNMPSDASDEEILRRLHEIFVEEQKATDEVWNDIAIDFLLAKNRNKSNAKWIINSIPEDISIILTCNTESSFDKYGEVSNENDMDEPAVTTQKPEIEDENKGMDKADVNSYLGTLYSVYDGDDMVVLYMNDANNLCVSCGYGGEPGYSQIYDAYEIEDGSLYGYAGETVDEFMFEEDGQVMVLLAGAGSGHYQSYIREYEYWETDRQKELGFE